MITCIFEDKGPAALRHVTVNAVVVKDGKVLLGKRGTYKGKPMLEFGKWGLIGGFLNRDENLEEALRREAIEETGWKIANLKLFHIKDNPDRPKEDRQNVCFVFIVDAVDHAEIVDEEVSELRWFGLDELPPKEDFAFDHGDDVELYKRYQQKQFPLPVLGKI